jgi:phosphatidylserine/phosphatidylglycerophosphate/cardiolipin synthase-like enzyme
MSHTKVTLIVQPGDSFFPIVEAIDAARTSINLTIFRMDDPVVQQALLEAAARGVRVRALVATNPRGWVKENKKLLKELGKRGVETKNPAADTVKKRYHYKILTVDADQSLVLTFNPTRENLHYTRDYGVVVRDPLVTAELNRLFDADWNDTPFEASPAAPLAISPYNSRDKVTEFLGSATRSIHISDAKLRDKQVLGLLREKAASGVDVRVLGMEPAYRDRGTPIQYRQITRFKMHAKCTVVDSERAFIGSMNLRAVALDKRREVGIFVDDAKAIAQLEHVFSSDWEQKSGSLETLKTQIPGVAVPTPVPEEPPMPTSDYALLSRTDALSRFPLFPGENAIGRSSSNDVVISHPSVSRSHAKIVINGERPVLVDLESQNGTYLNGAPVTGAVPLKPGDIIGIAQSDEFRFIEV